MKIKGALIGLVVVAVLVVGGSRVASWWGEKQFAARADQLFAELAAGSKPVHPVLNPAEDLAELPEPVREYLVRALPQSSRSIRSARIKQTGRIKAAEDSSRDDYVAVQLSSLNQPGLAWVARMEYLPLVPATIMTGLLGPQAWTESSLWGLLPIFENESYSVLRYLLQRWLAEAVWYPEVLARNKGLVFQAAESKQNAVARVKALLKAGEFEVRGEFHFFRSTKAPFLFIGESIDGYHWYCEYWDWKKIDGRQIPTRLKQGLMMGASRDERLEINVKSITYQ